MQPRFWDHANFLLQFAPPPDMRGREMERAIGAMDGLYGSTAAEAIYPSYMVDSDGDLLDAARNDYKLRFPGGVLPPVDAFWSLTKYGARTRPLVPNPLGRYLINSTMIDQIVPEANGDIVLYLQAESPGEALQGNWLPAPNGPFSAVLRLYLPKPEALDGRWQAPPITRARRAS